MAASLLSRLMWCRDSDLSVLLPSADVMTLTVIARYSDMMSRHFSANIVTLDF